jgi:5-methylcytosine-specific restriction protein B
METWLERTGLRLRGVLQYLDEHGPSATRHEIVDAVAPLLAPNDEELVLRANGTTKWLNDLLFQTTNLVKAGWMTKDGWGLWTITDAGRRALREFPDSTEFHRESSRRFQQWRRDRDRTRQRAWLIRGSSVLGVNLVGEWLTGGFVSVAGSQLRPIHNGIDATELEAAASEDYSHLKHQELRSKVDEIVAFVTRMRVGDLVLTTSDQHVYVGDVTGDWTYQSSEGGRSNLRRAVSWRNPDAPVDYAELPTPLPARLQTGATVLDLTNELAIIDALGTTVDESGSEFVETQPELKRHERLPQPTKDLADALFVDHEWLAEVGDLLDERRQLIFYGPPGTGKTWIAQKLAADLVGPEQVKLVQFHPAYTYEDFFEGYRPMTGATAGTIAFELRAGPFRQLVNRARQHPDQAFVLIIDEINRANLAKVFGELYFLLEYRDQAVDLLYSSDEEGFTLPTNLYVIGTMNTADRSIALLDAAMRRRFAFVELSPDTEPTRSLLARWSEHHGLGALASDLLAELNRRIDDPDFRIGPSYFMKHTGPDAFSPARLSRIWRTSILPLLQEHHYGQWDQAAARYQLDSLLTALTPPSGRADAGVSAPEGSVAATTDAEDVAVEGV